VIWLVFLAIPASFVLGAVLAYWFG